MIEGQDIICFSTMRWQDQFWTSRHYIVDEFVKHGNRVLFVNPGINLGELVLSPLRRHNRAELWTAVRRMRPAGGPHRVRDNLWALTYVYLPRFSFARVDRLTSLLDNLNARLLGNALRRSLRRLGFQRPIVWNSFMISWAVQAIDQLGAKLLIYHCTDEFATEDPPALARLVEWERQMLRKADLVFAVSPSLCEAKRRHNPRTYFVPHGVSADLIARMSGSADGVPNDMAGIPRPRIGVVGMVSHNYDLTLLEVIAKAHSEWSLVIVGPVDSDLHGPFATLLEQPNVHWLGAKRAVDLAGYLRCLNVGLLPYRLNRQTLQVSCPLKLLQYLAAGLPVVSTPIPGTRPYADEGLVACASDPYDFVQAISQAMATDSPERRDQRTAVAKTNTWGKQVEEMSKIIRTRSDAAAP